MLLRAHRRDHRERPARADATVDGARRGIGAAPARSAREIVELVTARAISPTEAVLDSLAALRADAFNAVVFVRDEDVVLRDARSVEEALSTGRPLPLAGLPFTVKDTLAAAGMPARAGSRLLEGVAEGDAGVVARLRAAGAVLVGRTSCAEFALSPVSGNALAGTTVNPLDPGTSPGGSSCGCAAAVAAGEVPLSVGTDYGGSVRFPAACTGIVGMRPAAESVPGDGQLPVPPADSPRERFSLPGPLVRTVDDLELVLPVLAGQALGPSGLPPRCGLLRDGGTRALQPGVVAALDAAASSLERHGVPVDELQSGLVDECERTFSTIRTSDSLDDLRRLAAGRERLLSAAMRHVLTPPPRDVDATAAWAARSRLRERVAHAMRTENPVLLLPVATDTAPPAIDSESVDAAGVAELFAMLAPSRAMTLLGFPAIAVGGVQVVAMPGREGDAVALARVIEDGLKKEDR